MRIVVTGGRDYVDRERIFSSLDRVREELLKENFFGISSLAHGGARGVDEVAGEWAWQHGICVRTYPVTKADWEREGKKAGHLRNARMLRAEKPDVAVAFPGGRGTANCVRTAIDMGFRIIRVERE